MKRMLVALLVACGEPRPVPASPPPAASTAQPSQNEQLYAKGDALEKEGRWEEAANTYQKYVLAMGNGLTHTDRMSMEVRIIALREKVWPKPDGPPKAVTLPADFEPPRHAGPCAESYETGKYDEAIACWRDDYVRTKNPLDILYAARASELNMLLRPAVDLYERFLEAADVGNDRRVIEARITVLRERLTSRSAEPRRR